MQRNFGRCTWPDAFGKHAHAAAAAAVMAKNWQHHNFFQASSGVARVFATKVARGRWSAVIAGSANRLQPCSYLKHALVSACCFHGICGRCLWCRHQKLSTVYSQQFATVTLHAASMWHFTVKSFGTRHSQEFRNDAKL